MYNMYKKIHNYIFTKKQLPQNLTAFFPDFSKLVLIESILLAEKTENNNVRIS